MTDDLDPAADLDLAARESRLQGQLARQGGRDAPPGRATGTGTVPATPSTITAPGRALGAACRATVDAGRSPPPHPRQVFTAQ